MKALIITTALLIFIVKIAISQNVPVQASPSNLNAPANAQPVPNALKTEKSAPTPKPEIVLPTTEKPPIYPGAEVHAVETQRNLIFPAAPPAPTQPAQTQPLTPVESTNTLNPTQPKRDAASRENPVTDIQSGVPAANAGNIIVNPGAAQVLQNTSAPTVSPAPVQAELRNSSAATTQSSKANMAMRLDGTAGTTAAATTVKPANSKAGVKKSKANNKLP